VRVLAGARGTASCVREMGVGRVRHDSGGLACWPDVVPTMMYEDLLHFMLECPAYDHIREQHPTLFPTGYLATATAAGRLRSLFGHDDQESLAQCVWDMNAYRSFLLGMQRHGIRVHHQPPSYVPADAGLRCHEENVVSMGPWALCLLAARFPMAYTAAAFCVLALVLLVLWASAWV
jgi:hypothetical protein